MKEFQSRIDKDKGKDKKSMTVVAEKSIQSTNTNFEMNGRIDFVVLEEKDNDESKKQSVVMIIEFGMGHDIWSKR